MSTATSNTGGKKSSATTRLTITGLLLLVLLPIFWRGLRGESDRWRAARAMETWLDGDHKTSIETLQAISARLPEDHRLKLILGEWFLQDYQAEKALVLAREIPEQFRDRRVQTLIQHCLWAIGKPDEALEEFRDANPPNDIRTPEQGVFHKNSLAYFQALANQELPLALRNSRLVVNEVASLWNRNQNIPLSSHMQGLFCSAIVYRHQMQRYKADEIHCQEYADKATTILSGAIEYLEDEYERISQLDTSLIQTVMNAFLWDTKKQKADKKAADEHKENAAQALATVLTLRALFYQDMQQDSDSFRDRRRVIELGYQPEELADMMPAFSDCVYQLELIAMVLDTRGCVNYQLNNIPEALADLNIAVMGQKALVDVAEFRPRTRLESSLDPRQQFEQFVRQPQRTLAALLFHRSWALRSAGDPGSAAKDMVAIRDLGFVPGNYLF